jgi:anthranilate synthase/aminodeoxychorismate synthase-like glutamine amidotransferase
MLDKDLLLIDNYDSFTYNLYDYWLRLGVSCTVIRNDELSLEAFKQLNFKGLVLSPGPQKPKDAGLLMPLIEHFYDKKPIFGICLGHQGIGEFFGAKLIKGKIPVHGKTAIIQHQDTSIFQNLPPNFNVMRYHSLILESLENTTLKVTATTLKNEIMAFEHKTLPIHGVQFHPESILTEFGLEMMANWLKLVGIEHKRNGELKIIK